MFIFRAIFLFIPQNAIIAYEKDKRYNHRNSILRSGLYSK